MGTEDALLQQLADAMLKEDCASELKMYVAEGGGVRWLRHGLTVPRCQEGGGRWGQHPPHPPSPGVN